MSEADSFFPLPDDSMSPGPDRGRSLNRIRAWVLAGGESSRMGTDKATLMFGSQSLLHIAVAKAVAISGTASVLCGAQPQRAQALAPAVLDVRTGCGPLGGIEAALLETDAEWNLFLAVDTPLIPLSLLQAWVALVLPQESAGAARLVDCGRIHALPLLLRRETLSFLQGALDAGNYRLQKEVETAVSLLGMKVLHIDADSLALADSSSALRAARPGWFSNGNTPAEFKEMRAHAVSVGLVE